MQSTPKAQVDDLRACKLCCKKGLYSSNADNVGALMQLNCGPIFHRNENKMQYCLLTGFRQTAAIIPQQEGVRQRVLLCEA